MLQAYEFSALALTQQSMLLLLMFMMLERPNLDADDDVGRAQAEKVALRIRLLIKDVMPSIEFFDVQKQFVRNSTWCARSSQHVILY